MKILVIEDQEKHLADAKEFFAGIQGYEFFFATSLLDVVNLGSRQTDYVGNGEDLPNILSSFDGVITDYHFAVGDRSNGGMDSHRPIGMMIMLTAFLLGIPAIGVTDKDHHQSHLQWFTSFYKTFPMQERRFMRDICNLDEDGRKKWGSAWELIKWQIKK